MKRVTTPEQEEKLNDIRKILTDSIVINEQDRIEFPQLRDLVEDVKKKLGRSIKQFDSNVSIVIVVGMLKAGKSTLINLFARNVNASPVGFGVDTTLRPVLIKMRDADDLGHGEIALYFPDKPMAKRQNSEGDVGPDIAGRDKEGEEAERLQEIIDALRGIRDEEIHYRRNAIQLTQDNLRKALCEESRMNDVLPSEPDLVVVNLPYEESAELLKDGNYLLDMPGLDSANASISLLTGRYTGLVRECDMVLCLQSSVAPLNQKALDCFSKVLETRSTATACVIQNNMSNKPWLTQDAIDAEKQVQRSRAKEVVEKLSQDVPMYSTNLGQAYAALLEKEKRLRIGNEMPDGIKVDVPLNSTSMQDREASDFFKETDFKKLEDAIIDSIRENGSRTRCRHCKDSLSEEVSEAMNQMKERKHMLDTELRDCLDQCEKWEKIGKLIDDRKEQGYVFRYEKKVGLRTDILKKSLQDAFPTLSVDADAELDSEADSSDSGNILKGSDMNRYLRKGCASCKEKAQEFVTGIGLRDIIVEEDEGTQLSLKEKLREEANVQLKGLRDKITEVGNALHIDTKDITERIHNNEIIIEACTPFPVPDDYCVSTEDPPKRYKEKAEWLGISWWEKTYRVSESELTGYRDDIIRRYIRQINIFFEERRRGWLEDTLHDCVVSELREVDNFLQHSIAEKVVAKEKKERELRLVNDIIKRLNDIKSFQEKL